MSEKHTIKGTVETVLPLETFASGFTKRVLVINTGGKYPQMIPVEFVKDNTELLSGLFRGQEVEASVNIRGNEYNGKYYANIQGWRLEKGEAPQGGKQAPPQSRPATTQKEIDEKWEQEDEEESIPF